MRTREQTIRAAGRVLSVASAMSERAHWGVRAQIEEMRVHVDGTVEGDSAIIVTGNWNAHRQTEAPLASLPERVGRALERVGAETWWSDMHAACGGCGKLVTTEPDSCSWYPRYQVRDGELVCAACLLADPEDYLSSVEGDRDERFYERGIDPEDYGYIPFDVSQVCSSPAPHEVHAWMRRHDVPRYIVRRIGWETQAWTHAGGE